MLHARLLLLSLLLVSLHYLRPHSAPSQEPGQSRYPFGVQRQCKYTNCLSQLTLRTDNVSPQCLAFCGLSCLGISFVLPMLSRGDMRAKYQLKGNACADCLCACCCQPCDLTQQDKEAQYREEQNKPMLAQPGKEGGMMYQAQQQQPQFHHG